MIEEKITIGDIVVVTDESYVSKAANSGGLELAVGSFKRDQTEFVVLATGCIFAKFDGQDEANPWQNNTVIQERGRDLILFIEDDQLEKVEIGVREVTMVEVCAQFGENVKVIK